MKASTKQRSQDGAQLDTSQFLPLNFESKLVCESSPFSLGIMHISATSLNKLASTVVAVALEYKIKGLLAESTLAKRSR